MIRRTYHCDGPDCERTWGQQGHKELLMPVITNAGPSLHFCSWDCVMRYAATKEPETVVEP
jgi:hypothetical protein